MSEAKEIDSFYLLDDEIKYYAEKLKHLHDRIRMRLIDRSEDDSLQHILLIKDLFNIKQAVESITDELMSNQFSEPVFTANHIWHIIEMYSDSPETVTEGTHLLEHFFKLKMQSMIKPTNYFHTISNYVKWQNETVKFFVAQFKQRPKDDRHARIEHLWNWNYRANEVIFFGGAARPLHLKRVTDFSALMGVYYDMLWPTYKEYRNALAEALTALLTEESRIHWPDYEIFPSTSSGAVVDKCLQYLFFKDRKNTWFINSSQSDYIPFVSSAREIFAEKFVGSKMAFPYQHTTEWILEDVIQQCSSIYEQHRTEHKPIIIILLTSKNRLGYRIDVDFIHTVLSRQFSTVITIVDACQDGQAFYNIDIITYSKRFTATGAVGLVHKAFLTKNALLAKILTHGATFPVGILAQIYMNVNMANSGLVYGVEDLVNSARWHLWKSPIAEELHKSIDYSYSSQEIVEYMKDPVKYTFSEDTTGTIIILTLEDGGQVLLPKLWALLKKQGHSLDCFVMDNRYLKSSKGIDSKKVRELMANKLLSELRQMEALSSSYLIWPLVPFWVNSQEDISVEQLHRHFETCFAYHCCLRMSIGRSAYPGKLRRFMEHVHNIFENNELNVSDESLGTHSSQWLS